MKKLFILVFFAALIALCFQAEAQNLPAGKVKQWQVYKNTTPPGMVKTPALKAVPASGTGTIVLLTPDVNLQFTRLQKTNGEWKFGGAITPGISYSLVIGQGVKNADGSITVNPYFSLGAFGAFGAAQSETGAIVSSASFGGCIGLYKYATVAAGYDVLSKKPYIAIGAQLSIFNFNGSGSSILSFK